MLLRSANNAAVVAPTAAIPPTIAAAPQRRLAAAGAGAAAGGVTSAAGFRNGAPAAGFTGRPELAVRGLAGLRGAGAFDLGPASSAPVFFGFGFGGLAGLLGTTSPDAPSWSVSVGFFGGSAIGRSFNR